MNKTFWDYFKINFHWFLTVDLTYSFVFLHLLSLFAFDFYSKIFYSSFLISISSFLGIWAIILMMQLINYCIVTPYKPRVAPIIYAKPVEPANAEEMQRMMSNAQNVLRNSAVDMDIMRVRQRQRDYYDGEDYVSYMSRMAEQQNYARIMAAQPINAEQLRTNDLFRLYVDQYNRPSPIITPQDYVDSLKVLKSRGEVDMEFID